MLLQIQSLDSVLKARCSLKGLSGSMDKANGYPQTYGILWRPNISCLRMVLTTVDQT